MVTIIKTARGRITTRHGEDIGRDAYTGAKGHVGIDIGHGDATAEDLRLVAPASGKITAAGRYGSYGNRVVIAHGDGTWSLIAHMARILVSAGDDVGQGQDIGVMGNTGTVFVHAHQEYHRADGSAVDPLAYMSTTAGGPGTEIGDEFDMATLDDLRQIVNGAVQEVRNDVGWINNGKGNPNSLQSIRGAIDGGRADLDYIHQRSPYSLKQVRQAQANGQIALTKEQLGELSNQLLASVPAVLRDALEENEAAVLAAIKQMPAAFLTTLKAAL
ncbi:M23 family metallopeptidase [Agromyces sp. NBRC 114283]|uniref:M23 family metallopeptidase n=1 Tax=Agromyces sp. NBRC 114283 TaxID=2994521 RepID=UPI00249FF176|nr:M23 family metallopeptidase [Agromyces sp. NBRC 114283]GLU91359.1 hypothetical protein Agsp01_36140 [Agromyces sp. NBRC 114283]